MTPKPSSAEPSLVIGVDIGGTKTAFGLVRFPDGQVVARQGMKTPQGAASGAAFLDQVCAAVAQLRDETPGVQGIGLGLCELVDLDGGVSSGHRVQWNGLPVLARLKEIAPAVIEADVRAAALAEARWGAGKGYRDLLYLNIGTGISTCWVKDGVPHAGAHGHALAIASSPMVAACPVCGTHSAYILEDVAGGAALAHLYGAAIGRKIDSASEVLAAAAEGESRAQSLLAEAAQLIGVSAGLAINILDPAALVIGGGLGAREGPYSQAIEASIRRQVWSDQARQLPIRRAALGSESGLIGAAASWWVPSTHRHP
ncbi:MAG TPA: ROK family protein [Dongiaceae bacterium]|nr:ROK family protein [Dongiaceae bacterium]